MAAQIQIKRASSATANTAPSGNLAAGELAVSYGNAPANNNGGGRLFVGNSAGNGNIVIGGEYFLCALNVCDVCSYSICSSDYSAQIYNSSRSKSVFPS